MTHSSLNSALAHGRRRQWLGGDQRLLALGARPDHRDRHAQVVAHELEVALSLGRRSLTSSASRMSPEKPGRVS